MRCDGLYVGQVGDLVFYGSGIPYHVSIYIGNTTVSKHTVISHGSDPVQKKDIGGYTQLRTYL
jgi:cell wall-associated NlpC family hydrolase